MLKEIRQEDIEEIRLLHPDTIFTPYELVVDSFETSTNIDALIDDEVIAVGGVKEITPNTSGAIWMIGSPLLNQLKHKKELLKRAKPLIDKYLTEYSILFNYCSNNPSTLRLLKRLGFTIQDLPDPTIKYFYITR